MGLTYKSTDIEVNSCGLKIIKESQKDKIIAVAGNPNVGKSTVFNALTGMNQHTGNWPGKTVTNTQGQYKYKDSNFILVDIPGTYSIMSNSAEEEIARDFICFGNPDLIVVVVDATCLERNLNLVLQILEITSKVIVCVNLLDEAKKKKILIDLNKLSNELGGVPVVGTSARSGKGLTNLQEQIYISTINNKNEKVFSIKYDNHIENAISILEQDVKNIICDKLNARWVSIKLLDSEQTLNESLSNYINYNFLEDTAINNKIKIALENLKQKNIEKEVIRDAIVEKIVEKSEEIYNQCVRLEDKNYNQRDRKLDKLLTSKLTGIPIMILLLLIIFWLTIVGANYPSELISYGLFFMQDKLLELFYKIGAPQWLTGLLIMGMYRTLAWVVSVMLPPMAIFFPLFTLLEDSGYLPRIAFNMDKFFKKACAHGKQALTMCMGFGCNACGVIGCRIIDSPRERLIAIITNNFVPCNGRFPTLITLITIFFTSTMIGITQSLVSTIILTSIIVLGIFMTLLTSKILSNTILKGIPSSFSLELPPYRKPQIGKVIVRSIFDRTLFVLGRAVVVAAPAGLIIWIMSNVTINDSSLLLYCTNFLDPFAKLLGLDGVILMAFFLGFPANEIVIPIIVMSYLSTGSIMEMSNLMELKNLLVNNGWTWITAICVMLFSLMHFPCGTTCWTIKKETKSWKWTTISFLVPTLCGMIICFIFSNIARLINI